MPDINQLSRIDALEGTDLLLAYDASETSDVKMKSILFSNINHNLLLPNISVVTTNQTLTTSMCDVVLIAQDAITITLPDTIVREGWSAEGIYVWVKNAMSTTGNVTIQGDILLDSPKTLAKGDSALYVGTYLSDAEIWIELQRYTA